MLEHQSQDTTLFMINLTLKTHTSKNSSFNFVTNFGFTS